MKITRFEHYRKSIFLHMNIWSKQPNALEMHKVIEHAVRIGAPSAYHWSALTMAADFFFFFQQA